MKRSRINIPVPALITGGGLSLLLLWVTLYQVCAPAGKTASDTFLYARLLVTEPPGSFAGNPRDFLDPGKYALLRWSGPETSILWDYGLTHLPGEGNDPRVHPVKNLPERVPLRIFRGKNHEYAGIRSAEYHVYFRRANDPDRENILPEPVAVYRGTLTAAEDQKTLMLAMPDFSRITETDSHVYPQNVNLILLKIIIKDIYKGSEFPDLIRISGEKGAYD